MSREQLGLVERLSEWLDKQGYPLEMTVAEELRRAGFRVSQSDYYPDPQTGEYREIDVVATAQETSNEALLRVSLVIECKSSRDKPWVMFTTDGLKLSPRAWVSQRAASILGEKLLMRIADRPEMDELGLLRRVARSAYGMTQAFTGGNDVTFAAAMSAAKASEAFARSADEWSETTQDFADILFPIVVVDGKLFEFFLNEDSAHSLSEISEGVLSWRNPVVGMPHTIIHVVTLSAFPAFVSGAADTARFILRHCGAEFSRAREDAKELAAKRTAHILGKSDSER